MAKQHSTTTPSKQDKAISKALDLLQTQLKHGDSIEVSGPLKVKQYLTLALANEVREVFMVLFLDTQNRLIEAEIMFHGTLTQTAVYPREVVKQALAHNAASVIFAHNHPSGVAVPSESDKTLTAHMKKSLALVDIQVLDHIVIAGKDSYSFSENGILPSSKPPVDDENTKYEKERYKKPIGDLLNYINSGVGVGSYLEALGTDDKEKLESIGVNIADTAFTSLATIGKLMVYADMNELIDEADNIGWLIVTLSELGINARSHAGDAVFIRRRNKELHQG